jgi:2-polyprenyl-3-methyl-5-hydroxy-6-metoxy-1,4-benzoquinol methylase
MKTHWENIYDTKQLHEVSWFQPKPTTSLALIEMLDLNSEAKIIDIGGGDSLLVDNLLQHGFNDLSVLDISGKALLRAQGRIGEDNSAKVKWIEADISTFVPDRVYDIWHDRAVFHFLTDPESVAHYVAISSAHIKKGGYLIVATFSEDGPHKCSGLTIQQYNEESLPAVFAENFETERVFKEIHITPTGNEQSFVFAVLRRK